MGIFAAKMEITPETVLQRKGDLLFNEIDGEVVMLSVENSEYYGMDKVASRIWELLEHPLSLKELISRLMSEYKVSEERCTEDTLTFINLLKKKKLISYE